MIRKIFVTMMAVLLVLGSAPVRIMAEEGDQPDYSNTGYWESLCMQSSSNLSIDQQNACKAYIANMSQQSASLQKQLNDIEARRADIAKDVQKYAAQVRNYDNEIAKMQAEIDEMQAQIDELVGQIAVKEEEIATKEAEIESLKAKVKDRMVLSQETMRLNKYLDFIMGAESLADLIRRSNGLNDIADYDHATLVGLGDMIAQLEIDRAELQDKKFQLDVAKEQVDKRKEEVVVKREEARVVYEEFKKKEAELEAEGNRIAGNLEAIKELMTKMMDELNKIPASGGFSYPVPGAHISAGTWYYPAGGVHLGEDFAAGVGTPVYAVGNGVVIKSVDGCGYGYLGNTCGSAQGGSSGGGNQIYLLTSINGSLYAVKYLHLSAGTPIAEGTIVSAGQYVGAVGSSGNSSGPHCHIEVFYLGTQSLASYATSWNGDLAFGAGWSYSGLSRACDNGVGAPCRYRPETFFGG